MMLRPDEALPLELRLWLLVLALSLLRSPHGANLKQNEAQ
jgi:hypothetical protein